MPAVMGCFLSIETVWRTSCQDRAPLSVLCFTEYYELRYVVRGAGVGRGRHEPDCISAVVPRKTITPCDRSQLFRLSKRTRAMIGRPGSSNGFAKEEEPKGIP